MEQHNIQSTDLAFIKGDEAKVLGDEFEFLISKKLATEQDEERVFEILSLALLHPEVDFWISNATSREAKLAGLLTSSAKKEYQDQKALLREHIGSPDLPPIRGRAVLPKIAQDHLIQPYSAGAEAS